MYMGHESSENLSLSHTLKPRISKGIRMGIRMKMPGMVNKLRTRGFKKLKGL